MISTAKWTRKGTDWHSRIGNLVVRVYLAANDETWSYAVYSLNRRFSLSAGSGYRTDVAAMDRGVYLAGIWWKGTKLIEKFWREAIVGIETQRMVTQSPSTALFAIP